MEISTNKKRERDIENNKEETQRRSKVLNVSRQV